MIFQVARIAPVRAFRLTSIMFIARIRNRGLDRRYQLAFGGIDGYPGQSSIGCVLLHPWIYLRATVMA